MSSIVVVAFIENCFAFVVFGAVAFSLLMSFLFFATRGTDSAYDQIGAGGMSQRSRYGREPLRIGRSGRRTRPSASGRSARCSSARSERLVRRGQPALDIDAELARLLDEASPAEGEGAPGRHDAELVRRSASSWWHATSDARARVWSRSTWTARSHERSRSSSHEIVAPSGINAP